MSTAASPVVPRATAEDLRSVPLLADLDAERLEELAGHSELLVLEPGDVLYRAGEPATRFYLLLEGELGTEARMEADGVPVSHIHHAPTYIGAIALLSGQPHPGDSRAVRSSRVATLDAASFLELVRTEPGVARVVLSRFAPIYQRLESRRSEREKLSALGQLSAGLAHELNNPAAAARRSAGELARTLDELDEAAVRFAELGVPGDALRGLVALRSRATPSVDPLALADREDELLDRLAAHGVTDADDLAGRLASAGVDRALVIAAAECLGPGVAPEALRTALHWLATGLESRELLAELDEGTARISELVGAVRDYSYLDRAPEQDVDVHDGLETTLTVLGHRLRDAAVEVRRDYDRTLPRIPVWGSELNQVWTNLLDNAIDALAPAGGSVVVRTAHELDRALVQIADDGPGIDAAARPRIFEPFFTTKGVGEGRGLGLDVAFRAVRRHRGEIDVESRPGRTVVSVRLPFAA